MQQRGCQDEALDCSLVLLLAKIFVITFYKVNKIFNNHEK